MVYSYTIVSCFSTDSSDRNGSERVVTTAREHIYDLRGLENYKFVDELGRDQGSNVRMKAKDMIDFIQAGWPIAFGKKIIIITSHDLLTPSWRGSHVKSDNALSGTECAIGEEQCGFRQGRRCMDQVFVLRQVCEKYLANGKDVFWAFIDLEMAYDTID